MYDLFTKHRYYIVKYQKDLIIYAGPVKIDLSLIDLTKLDDEVYKNEVKRVYDLSEFEMDILQKLKPLETQHGGGEVWSNGIMLINPDEQDVIDQLEKYSFHQMIMIDTGYPDPKFLKVVDDSNNEIKSLTLKEIGILFG